jgi:hypothetical protein
MIRYAADSHREATPRSAAPASARITIPSPAAEPVTKLQPGQSLVAGAQHGPEPLELSGDIAPKAPKQRSANAAKKRKAIVKPKAEATADAPPLLLDLEA